MAGLWLLRPAAGAVRGCADAERRRLRLVWSERIRAAYAAANGQGALARALGQWRDPVIWRDLGYLVAIWLPLKFLDVTVLSVWAALLIGVTLRSGTGCRVAQRGRVRHGSTVHGVALGYFPHGQAGTGAVGLYADTLRKAMLAAAIFGVLFVLFNYVLVKAASAHAGAARALLGPPRPRD